MDRVKIEELSFEEAVENLDKVVKNLSDPELSLDDAFKSYEDGIKLLKHCNDTLDKVEKKVMLINDNRETSIF